MYKKTEIKKTKGIKSVEKIDEDKKLGKKPGVLEMFFKEHFSDSTIVEKKISSKIKKIFNTDEKISQDFSHLKILFFLKKIKKFFPEKKIFSEKISKKNFLKNIKNFDKIFETSIKILSEIKNFSEVNISIEDEKEYLEVVNCNLVFDFETKTGEGKKKRIEITLQSDDFLKMVN